MDSIDRAIGAAAPPSNANAVAGGDAGAAGTPSWRRRLADTAIVATPLVVGGLGSVFTMDGLRVWYRTLRRPDWNPPDWVMHIPVTV